MATAGDIFNAVRILVDDWEGDYATDEAQAPLLQLVQEALVQVIHANPNVGKYKSVVVLPAVPASTTSLAAYFATGQPLVGLDEIVSMKEKVSGTPDYQYQNMEKRNDPPTLQPWDYNQFFSFNGSNITLPGATQALDLRIFGEFTPQPITSKDSPVLPGAQAYLKLATAAFVARAHGNKELSADYMGQANGQRAAILNAIVMEMQATPLQPLSYEAGNR